MEKETEATPQSELASLPDADLVGLRLAAQVLGHKAELDARPNSAAYFADLQRVIQATLTSRLGGIRVIDNDRLPVLPAGSDAEDRRLVNEYLGLLIANEQLSAELRTVCRSLRTANSE
jgi:hypothetical protein